MACAGDIATRKRSPPSPSFARSFPDSEDPLRQRRRSLPPHARHRASARPHRSRLRLALHLDKPVIFNFHGYASLIHKLTYRRTNHDNIHVRGYKEKGNINTPLELAILNQIDRFNLAIDVIDRVPGLQATAAHIKEWLKDQIIDSINYAHTEGIDHPRSPTGRGPSEHPEHPMPSTRQRHPRPQ